MPRTKKPALCRQIFVLSHKSNIVDISQLTRWLGILGKYMFFIFSNHLNTGWLTLKEYSRTQTNLTGRLIGIWTKAKNEDSNITGCLQSKYNIKSLESWANNIALILSYHKRLLCWSNILFIFLWQADFPKLISFSG